MSEISSNLPPIPATKMPVRKIRWGQILPWVILLILIAITLFPLYWALRTAFQPPVCRHLLLFALPNLPHARIQVNRFGCVRKNVVSTIAASVGGHGSLDAALLPQPSLRISLRQRGLEVDRVRFLHPQALPAGADPALPVFALSPHVQYPDLPNQLLAP